MKQHTRTFFLSSLAALASVVSPSRAGMSSPGSAAPLHGAPSPDATPHTTGPTNVSRLRRSLRACTAEGIFAELVNAFAGGALLTAWALHLGAGPLFTGVLVALPQIALLFHLPGAWTTALLGHRRACLWLVGASRQMGIVLVALPFLPLSDATRRVVLLAVAALAATLSMLGNNAWVAWMAELVPARIRGRYFGRRTGACVLGGAIAAAIAGVLLDFARGHGLVGQTLAGLQLLASLCGLHTVRLMRRQHDPAPGPTRPQIRLVDALAPFRDPRARGLLIYHLSWNGAVGLAGSFFALFMIRDLKMSFALIAAHGAAIALVRMLVAPLWGVLIDRLGARPVLSACSFAIAAIPFLWLLPTPDRLWPLALDALLAGVFWTGHALAAFALPLAVTSRAERPFFVAGFSAVSGLSFAAATAVGGTLALWLPSNIALAGVPLGGLQVLFILSGILRVGAAFLCLRVHEPEARGMNAVWSAIMGPLLRRSLISSNRS